MRFSASIPSQGDTYLTDWGMIFIVVCSFLVVNPGNDCLGSERAADQLPTVEQQQAFCRPAACHVQIAFVLLCDLHQSFRARRAWLKYRLDAVGAQHVTKADVYELLRRHVHRYPPLRFLFRGMVGAAGIEPARLCQAKVLETPAYASSAMLPCKTAFLPLRSIGSL